MLIFRGVFPVTNSMKGREEDGEGEEGEGQAG